MRRARRRGSVRGSMALPFTLERHDATAHRDAMICLKIRHQIFEGKK